MTALTHPRFGLADPETFEMFTGHGSIRYVVAQWGPWRIFAIVPATDVTVVVRGVES